MLLTITSKHKPASDLSFLLHKHPDKVQTVEISAGKAHIFYSKVTVEECTAVLLLDIDPVGLVRSEGPRGNDFALEQYVNDRPYVASSFMSAAIAKAFSTALNGRCKDKPDLVTVAMPLEVKVSVLPVKGGEALLRKLFEPLGYTIEATGYVLDPLFPEWGDSKYFTVILKNFITVQQLLAHLYVLIPVCDNDKHYWVSTDEVEKLLSKGKGWLESHPEQELITKRYLKNQKSLANHALKMLLSKDEEEADDEIAATTEVQELTKEQVSAELIKIHDLRLLVARDILLETGAKRVVDLGCGEGRLLKLLLAEKQFEFILGMDVSYRALEIAKARLRIETLPEMKGERIKLIQGSLTYRDKRIEGFDAAALIEVIEHLDEVRLSALQKTVFEFARPKTVVITTPNADYNVRFEDYEPGKMRHTDHRFEWSRKEFEEWGTKLSIQYGYEVVFSPIGEIDEEVGALSQMAVFKLKTELIEETTL